MQDAAEAAEGGRLAGAVLPKHDQKLAAFDMQVDAIDSAYIAEALAQALDQDHRRLESTGLPAGLEPRALRVLTLDDGDHQLHGFDSSSGARRSRTANWIFSRDPVASRRTNRSGSAAASRS